MDNPTNDIYQALLTAYTHFNDRLFDSSLPPCLIVLQRKAKTMGYVSTGRWVNASGGLTDELAVNPEFFLGYPIIEVMATLTHELSHIWQAHHGNPGRRGYHNTEWAEKMRSIGLIPSDTGKPGGKCTGESMGDYALLDGAFYRACVDLQKTGFGLPWLDRWPRPTAGRQTVFDAEGNLARFADRQDEIPLVAPLGGGQVPVMVDEGITIEISPVSIVAGAAGSAQGRPPTRKQTRIKYSCSCDYSVWGKPGLYLICGECNQGYAEVDG